MTTALHYALEQLSVNTSCILRWWCCKDSLLSTLYDKTCLGKQS